MDEKPWLTDPDDWPVDPNRSNRLAPLLVVAGSLLLFAYAGGYSALATRSLSNQDLYVDFDTKWLCALYYPAVWADATVHQRPITLCYPTAPQKCTCSIVNEHR